MEKKQVEEIMKNYNKREKEISIVGENTEYLNKLEEIKKQTIKNNRAKLHLERLQEELAGVTDSSIIDEYNKQIKNAQDQLQQENEQLSILEQEKEKMIVEKKKNERNVREVIKNKINELQDKTRKELVAKKNEIDLNIKKNKLAYENIKIQMEEFEYEYDENGVPTNGDVFRKMQEDLINISNQTKDLEEMSKQCEEHRQKLITPYQMPAELPDDKVYNVDFKKIEKVQQQDEGINRDYGNISLKDETGVGKVKNNQEKELTDIEKQNIINKIKEEMLNSNNDYKNIHLQADKTIRNEVETIATININEKEGMVYTTTKDGKKIEVSLEEILERKKATFKRLQVKDICKEVAGGRIKGLLLGTKVNPAIIHTLRNNPDMIETYIECLNEEKELPFELTHDLRESKLGILDKMKMWIHAKAEDKIPGTNVNFAKRFWNKNKALPEPTKPKVEKTSGKKSIKQEYQVENKENRIEKEATKVMSNAEKEIAKEVNEMSQEK